MFVLCWTILPTCKELSMQHIFFLHAKVSGINIWFTLFTLTLDVTLNATESFYVHKKGKLKERSRCCPFQVLFLQTVLTYASRTATKNILHPMQHTSGAFSISIILAHSRPQMHILLWEAKRPGPSAGEAHAAEKIRMRHQKRPRHIPRSIDEEILAL